MKSIIQNARSLVLLIAISIWGTQVNAQQKQAAVQSSAASMSNHAVSKPAYTVSQQNGRIILSDGLKETIISNDPSAVQPLLNGQEVYFIKKGNKTTGATICVYSILDKKTVDLLKQNSANSNFSFKEDILNMFLDKTSNKLFFSTSLNKDHNYVENLVWKYDLGSNQFEAYKDGSIEGIDNAGNQTIVFHGRDAKGQYDMRTMINPQGRVHSVIGKQYSLISNNK